jgi:hypothetical protein
LISWVEVEKVKDVTGASCGSETMMAMYQNDSGAHLKHIFLENLEKI